MNFIHSFEDDFGQEHLRIMLTKNSPIHEHHLSLFCKIRKKHYPPMLKGSIYSEGKDGEKEKMGLT